MRKRPRENPRRVLEQSPEDAVCRLYNIHPHPGWEGMFTTGEYPGAARNGTRMMKILTDPGGDTHGVGSLCTVLGSMGHPIVGVAYFVEWDDDLKVASLCLAWKLRPLDPIAVAMDTQEAQR